MQRPLFDQFDIIHTECGRHMVILATDDKTGNFLVGCPDCKIQLVIQLYIEDIKPENSNIEENSDIEQGNQQKSIEEKIEEVDAVISGAEKQLVEPAPQPVKRSKR